MKKKKIIIISLIVLIAIIFISAYVVIRNRLSIKGIIIEYNESEIYQNNILVYQEDEKTLMYIGLPENIDLKFKPRQEVRIYLLPYTIINMTYPGSIDSKHIRKIKIIKENANNEIVEKILEQWRLRKETLEIKNNI